LNIVKMDIGSEKEHM